MVLHLTEADVARLLPLEAAIAAVDEAFRDHADGIARDTARQRTQMPDGTLHVLQAASERLDLIGFKMYFPGKSARTFLVHLIELSTGRLLALIEADELGIRRTGAATAVATRALSRPDAAVLACFGSGRHAVTQLRNVAAVRDIAQVRVVGRSPERLAQFQAAVREATGLEATIADSPQAALAGADIVNIVTRSPTPLFDGALLEPGQHVNAVGSNALSRREIDMTAIRRAALIVVDSIPVAQRECGDLLPAADAGLIDWHTLPELGHVLTGRHPGRATREDITIFESQGMGLLDLYAANAVRHEAARLGTGRELDI